VNPGAFSIPLCVQICSSAVLEVVIDNCAIDPFVNIPGAYEAGLAAIERGNLKIWYVHTTLTEAATTEELDHRTRKLLVLIGLGKLVASSGLILDESRLDHAAPSDDAGAAALKALASKNLSNENHRRDALAAETARVNGWTLLTNEKRRLPNQARALGVEVLSTDELFAEIGFSRPA